MCNKEPRNEAQRRPRRFRAPSARLARRPVGPVRVSGPVRDRGADGGCDRRCGCVEAASVTASIITAPCTPPRACSEAAAASSVQARFDIRYDCKRHDCVTVQSRPLHAPRARSDSAQRVTRARGHVSKGPRDFRFLSQISDLSECCRVSAIN